MRKGKGEYKIFVFSNILNKKEKRGGGDLALHAIDLENPNVLHYC